MAVPLDASCRRPGRSRRAGLVAIAAFIGLPATAHADNRPDDLRDLATQAAEALITEQGLLTVADPEVAGSPGQLATVLERLADADAAGTKLLRDLVAAGADLSPDVRIALGPLSSSETGEVARPDASVYRSAVADLVALASAPSPLVVGERGGFGFRALATVALTLVAVGLTALLVSLRSARPQRELNALAWSDALTGVANRRRLDRDLAALATGDSGGRSRHPSVGPTAVIMVDIDHFKDINDQYGHRFGDDVLRAVGTMLASQVRSGDGVYRYGGEEFCVILPGATETAAHAVAERILRAARDLEFAGGVRITVSAGVADGACADVERTLRAADAALLRAKRSGRNQAAPAYA